LAADNFEQGGFAGTVAANQTDTFAGLNLHGCVTQNNVIAKLQGNFV